MSSIYERALGDDFAKLHPQMQRRFSLTSAGGWAAVGSGTMARVWHGKWYTLPFLYLGTWRRIMFPESGRDVAFTIENYAFVDPLGRETVTWIRTFGGSLRRRFDAYMIYAEGRKKIVDYPGSHEHLAVDIDLSVSERGGVRLRSGEQRFHEGALAFRFPPSLTGIADVHEWYDDADGRFHIDVSVSNARFGPLFGYTGAFDVAWIPAPRTPAHALPKRYESRE